MCVYVLMSILRVVRLHFVTCYFCVLWVLAHVHICFKVHFFSHFHVSLCTVLIPVFVLVRAEFWLHHGFFHLSMYFSAFVCGWLTLAHNTVRWVCVCLCMCVYVLVWTLLNKLFLCCDCSPIYTFASKFIVSHIFMSLRAQFWSLFLSLDLWIWIPIGTPLLG